jgi:acyl-CoA thioesterase
MTAADSTSRAAQETAERCAAVMFADDPASQSLGMRVVEVGPGRASVSMTVRPEMANGHRIAHGGFVFALADSAFAFACNTYDRRTVAASCDIVFLAPVEVGDALLARAQERVRRARSGIYDVTVHRGDEVVAEFRGHSREIAGRILEL